jgi:NurA-like 5'-3' nuclease
MAEILLKDGLEKIKKFNENLKWFQSHYEELTDQYKGEYVAINNNQIIDHDKDVHILVERLRKQYGDLSSFVIEHVPAQPSGYIL